MKKIYLLVAAICITAPSLLAQSKAGRVDTVAHPTYYTCPKHPGQVSKKPGTCPICGMALNRSTKEEMKASEAKNYTCPIHLDVVSHQAGTCPKCGKKLTLSPKEKMNQSQP
jgi:transcription initiation factor IIE alpha subunit